MKKVKVSRYVAGKRWDSGALFIIWGKTKSWSRGSMDKHNNIILLVFYYSIDAVYK